MTTKKYTFTITHKNNTTEVRTFVLPTPENAYGLADIIRRKPGVAAVGVEEA